MTNTIASPRHQALRRTFRVDTQLFARTMRSFGHDVPVPDSVTLLDADFTGTGQHARRADSALLAAFMAEGAGQRYIVVVEPQLHRDHVQKIRWPVCIAWLHHTYKCPVALVVVCNDPGVAQWAREPVQMGVPGLSQMVVTVSVIGPGDLAPRTDPARAAADPGLAVLAALTNSKSPQISAVLETLAGALGSLDEDTARVLADITAAGLHDTAGEQIWRTLTATAA